MALSSRKTPLHGILHTTNPEGHRNPCSYIACSVFYKIISPLLVPPLLLVRSLLVSTVYLFSHSLIHPVVSPDYSANGDRWGQVLGPDRGKPDGKQ